MEATTSPLVSQVTPAWLARVAAAVNTQLTRDVSPLYGGNLGVRVGSSPTDIQPGEMVFSIVDTLPDAPGDIAYHSIVGQNVPFGFLALSTCNTLDDVSTGVSHEMVESAGDISTNLWSDDFKGTEWARELCDAVEANSYPVTVADGGSPILVSDFLLPAFFGYNAVAPFCYTQANGLPGAYPAAPFATAAGCYQVRRASTGAETQVRGARLEGSVRAHRIGKVMHWSSRTGKRLAA